MDHNLFDSSQ